MKNIANIEVKDDEVFYDFSTFDFVKRLRMAYAICRYGAFTVKGKIIKYNVYSFNRLRQVKIKESEEV